MRTGRSVEENYPYTCLLMGKLASSINIRKHKLAQKLLNKIVKSVAALRE